jgi:hypothetical protein
VNEADALLLRAARGNPRGADAVWAAARQRHRHHPMLLGAALVLFVALVVAVAAVSLATRTTDDSQPYVTAPAPTEVTVTATGAQLETSVTVSSAELKAGSPLTAQVTFTNVGPEPMTVRVDPLGLMRLRWPSLPADLKEPASRLGIEGFGGTVSVSFRGIDDLPGRLSTPGAPPMVALEPGESTSFVTVLDRVEDVPTGLVTLTVTPFRPVGDGSYAGLMDAQVVLPLTALPHDDGTVRGGEAERLVFDDPRVAAWLTNSHEGWPSGTIPGTNNVVSTELTSDGWRFLLGIIREDPTGELSDAIRQSGLPGFIVHVDRQGVVTVEYLVE